MVAQLEEINKFCEGKKYQDKEAATIVQNNISKKPITTSPFIHHEFYNDGYWMFSWMACQFKDCVDCLTVLFPDHPYELMFLFDHSCSKDKKRQDGLDARNMCKNYGGKQPMM